MLVVRIVVTLLVVVFVIRLAVLDPAARRYWLPARWHRLAWPRLARNLRLARVDLHRPGKVARPRARFRPGPFGFVVSVRLIHGVSRSEFEKNAEHLANAWRCHRVSITQPRPGRLQLRAVRRDPLAEPVGADVLTSFDGRHLVLGRDEMGDLRQVDLANLSGSVIAGNPGRGKSQSAASLAVQLVPSPAVEFYVLDGGGGLDWSPWRGAAIAYADDDLADAEELLLELHSQMMQRRRTLEADHGVRNGWKLGPAPGRPLRWLLAEESSIYFDLDSVKGDRDRERHVRACRGLVGQLLRRGRAPMHHTTLVCQKAVSGAGGLPPELRDLCGARWSFGCATVDAAIGALGTDIRQYETMSPTLLQGDQHVGVATVLLKTGLSPYTLVKFPEIAEDLADRVAKKSARRPAEPQEIPALTAV